MKAYRSFVGHRGPASEHSLPAQPPSETHDARTSLPATAESLWDRLQNNLLRREFLPALALVVVASTAAIAPMLVLGTVAGRDFPFHLASWMDVARQWHEGTIFPQWAELANWGLGEPRFVFYPPGSWMLGAALGSLLPWKAVPMVFVWLVLLGAGLSMFLLARESMPRQQATLAAMFFAVNPYHLLLIYYRSDFAELLASAFFPLLPWGVIRIARGGWRAAPSLALVVALIWLSNAPAAVIAVYSLAFLCVVAYAVRRELPSLMYGALAVACGFGLAAFYILPAAHQRSWVRINEVLTDGLRPERNFLFSRATSMAVNTDFNLKISCVVFLMAVLIAGAAIYFAKSVAIPRLHYWLLLALGAMSVFMMFRFSQPLWWIAPELHFVQFPWRFAVPLGVAFAFFLGAAAGKFRSLSILAVSVFVFAGPAAKTLLAVARPSSWKKAEISQLQRDVDSGKGYIGTPEYLPNGSNSKALENVGNETRAGSQASDGLLTTIQNGERNTFRVKSTELKEITLRLFDYPTWQVDVDGSRMDPKRTDKYGRIVVTVPSGSHFVHIFLQRKWDAMLGMAISIAVATLLSFLIFAARGKIALSTQPESKFERRFPTATAQAPATRIVNKEQP